MAGPNPGASLRPMRTDKTEVEQTIQPLPKVQTMHPVSLTQAFEPSVAHLGVGQHKESHERTRVKEEELDVPLAQIPVSDDRAREPFDGDDMIVQRKRPIDSVDEPATSQPRRQYGFDKAIVDGLLSSAKAAEREMSERESGREFFSAVRGPRKGTFINPAFRLNNARPRPAAPARIEQTRLVQTPQARQFASGYPGTRDPQLTPRLPFFNADAMLQPRQRTVPVSVAPLVAGSVANPVVRAMDYQQSDNARNTDVVVNGPALDPNGQYVSSAAWRPVADNAAAESTAPQRTLDLAPFVRNKFVEQPHAMVPAQLLAAASERTTAIEDEDAPEDDDDQQDPGPSTSILPPVLFINKATPETRLRYASEVIKINDEVYVKVDNNHLVNATYADWLFTTNNVTIRQPQFLQWSGARREGRPQILFQLYHTGEYDYTAENGRRKKPPAEFRPLLDPQGRVYLNPENHVLKDVPILPTQVSTEIEGWEMEALCRLNPDICLQDFIDRMVLHPAGVKGRPSRGTLNHRRRRDRIKMRILPWPIPRQLSYSDSQILKQLSEWGMTNNTTVGLEDLTKEQIDVHYAIMYGGHLERSGANAQNNRARLGTLVSNLRLVRTMFAEDSEEVGIVNGRIAEMQQKISMEYDAAPRRWDPAELTCELLSREK